MTEPDDRDERISALEARVRRVEQDAAAARVLAGGADRDVADLGGEVRGLRGEVFGLRGEFGEYRDHNNRVLNAMREDLTDLRTGTRAEFADVRTEMRAEFADVRTEMRTGFAEMRTGFAEMRGRLDAAAAGHEQLARMLTVLIDREGGQRP